MFTRPPRPFVRPFFFTALAGGALLGCELAVDPDVSLAVVPPQTCAVCLDASDTVITEPDGNVLIVPVASLDDGGNADDAAAGDALDASEAIEASAADR
jgi:hypothetical protein